MRRFFINFEDLGTSLTIGRMSYKFKEIVIDVISDPGREISYCDGPHIAFLGEERSGAHDVLGYIEFKDKANLRLAEKGFRMVQKAIDAEQDKMPARKKK